MNIVESAEQYIDALTIEGAAKRFGKSQATVKSWIKLRRYPQEVFEDMLGAQEEKPVEQAPEPTEEEIEAEMQKQLDAEAAAEESANQPRDLTSEEAQEARLVDIENRLIELEMAFVSSRTAVPSNGRGGGPEHASLSRPGGRVPVTSFPDGRRSAMQDYNAGTMTGRAPTREQAHWSSMGQRGQLAKPAQPRLRKPNSPGNHGWNLPKAELERRRAAARQVALANRAS